MSRQTNLDYLLEEAERTWKQEVSILAKAYHQDPNEAIQVFEELVDLEDMSPKEAIEALIEWWDPDEG